VEPAQRAGVVRARWPHVHGAPVCEQQVALARSSCG
jgi:hypothetical protein